MSYQIHTASKCTWKEWKSKNVEWDALMTRLAQVKRTTETEAEYRRMSKERKLQQKDVGGFVAGALRDNERKLQNIENRTLIVLDADDAKPDLWDTFRDRFPGIRAAMHTTHSHTADHPRIRLIVAPDRALTISEHEIMAHYITGTLGAEQFDASTYEPHRLMFWPSCPSDGQYLFGHVDGEPLRYDDVPVEWYDAANWPETGMVKERRLRERTKMGEPTEKPGLIGAFCRVYGIADAIAEFLSDVYEEGAEDRYTFRAGSTANGLQVFEDKFAYSHHGTDPAGGRECNAWDLVRIHLFGGQDDDPDKDISKQPSQQAMMAMVMERGEVVEEQVRTRLAEARESFADDGGIEETDENWMRRLEVDQHGHTVPSRRNLHLILMNDEGLKGRIGFNRLTRRVAKTGPLPWDREDQSVGFLNKDLSNLYEYLEGYSRGFSEDKVKGGIEIVAHRHAFHPVADYLNGLSWDGVERAERLLVDQCGAEDTEYVRAVTKAWLLGAVKRAQEPGCRMQYMLLLTGEQGIGKSSFLRQLAVRPEWFSDRVPAMDSSKEALESIMGKWFIEVGELHALKKGSDAQEAIKAFITAESDYYRAPYAAYAEDVPRSCVFSGTSNALEVLRDSTGGRRFWPVAVKSVNPCFAVDQIWAEVMTWYFLGEEPYLSREVEVQAKAVQEDYREDNAMVGIIKKYLEAGIPDKYEEMDIDELREWWSGGKGKGVRRREYICGSEIYSVLFSSGSVGRFPRREQLEIKECLRAVPGWAEEIKRRTVPIFGEQRTFKRI